MNHAANATSTPIPQKVWGGCDWRTYRPISWSCHCQLRASQPPHPQTAMLARSLASNNGTRKCMLQCSAQARWQAHAEVLTWSPTLPAGGSGDWWSNTLNVDIPIRCLSNTLVTYSKVRAANMSQRTPRERAQFTRERFKCFSSLLEKDHLIAVLWERRSLVNCIRSLSALWPFSAVLLEIHTNRTGSVVFSNKSQWRPYELTSQNATAACRRIGKHLILNSRLIVRRNMTRTCVSHEDAAYFHILRLNFGCSAEKYRRIRIRTCVFQRKH
jgi:hypothetical protein